MTLRTTAVIAGVLGLLMLVAGLIADAARADREVVTQQTLDTPVVVLGPEVLALPGLERIAVNADGGIEAHAARPVDADAWLKHHSATYVLGYSSWDSFAVRSETRLTVPSASPSPSPSASASAETAASPEPTTEPAAEPAAEDESASEEQAADYGSPDLWRHTWRGENRVAITGGTLAPGESLVVFTESGEPIGSIEVYAQREVNDGWIAPLVWVGGALALLGVVALISGLVDIRPLQARLEAWSRKRSGVGAAPPRPGSRRERRLAGSTLPEVSLEEPHDAAVTALHDDNAQKGGAS